MTIAVPSICICFVMTIAVPLFVFVYVVMTIAIPVFVSVM